MPDQYIDIPIVVDESSLYNTAVATIQDAIPGWEPAPGKLMDILLHTLASMAAVGAEVASDVPFSVFEAFGPLVRIPPIAAAPATVNSTWTVQDNNGYTIPANTPVGLTSADISTPIGFQTLVDAVVPAGSTSIANVQLVAVDDGEAGNSLDTVFRADSLGFVTNITLAGASMNGADAEDSDTYVTRLSQELETLSTTPILGKDFAIIARQVSGVYRCGYIDNYDPVTNTYNNEKMVAVCPLDVTGTGANSATRTAVLTLLESLREVNFICNVVSPTYTTINVTFTAQAQAGQDVTVIQNNIIAALQSLLSPANWGIPQPLTGDVPLWVNTTTLRINKVIQAIEDVIGVAWAEPVTIGISGGALGSADIVLPGAFPLPQAGVITATVNPG